MKKKNNMKNLTPYITLFLFITICLVLVNFKGTKVNSYIRTQKLPKSIKHIGNNAFENSFI